MSGSRGALSLWLFYMQASVSWTGCELQLVASARTQNERCNIGSFGLVEDLVVEDQKIVLLFLLLLF